MKYLKKYESSDDTRDLILKNRSDIVSTISNYCNRFEDRLVNEFEDKFGLEYDNSSDRYNEIGYLDVICIEMIIYNVLEDTSSVQDKFWEYYCDFYQSLYKRKESMLDPLKEILGDYIDDSDLKVDVKRTSDKSDDRYIISITSINKDIIDKISLKSLVGRISDIGFPHFKYEGNDQYIHIQCWKPLKSIFED